MSLSKLKKLKTHLKNVTCFTIPVTVFLKYYCSVKGVDINKLLLGILFTDLFASV